MDSDTLTLRWEKPCLSDTQQIMFVRDINLVYLAASHDALAAKTICHPRAIGHRISKVGISARYLLRLINDILNTSRIESGKHNVRSDKIPTEEFLWDVNTIIYDQAQAKGLSYDSIVTGFVADNYTGDAMKLQQVLVNLLGNAVKFTPRGGKVQRTVSQERPEKDKALVCFVATVPLGVTDIQIWVHSAVALNRLSALIVDDELLICRQAKRILQQIGMKAEWVTGDHEAIERVKARWTDKSATISFS